MTAQKIRLTPTSHDIHKALSERGPMTAGQLCMQIKRSELTVYDALERLHARGLVIRRDGPQPPKGGRAPYEWAIRTEENASEDE